MSSTPLPNLSWLDAYFLAPGIADHGTQLPRRPLINLIGDLVTVTDDPDNNQIVVQYGSVTGDVCEVPENALDWKDPVSPSATTPAAGASVRSRRRSHSTTSSTTGQVLDSGGVYGDMDLTLPDNAITRVDVVVNVKLHGSANGGTILLSAVYVRNGGGSPTVIGTVQKVITMSAGMPGGALDHQTSAVTLDANLRITTGNMVKVDCDPGTASRLDWRLVRQHTEGAE